MTEVANCILDWLSAFFNGEVKPVLICIFATFIIPKNLCYLVLRWDYKHHGEKNHVINGSIGWLVQPLNHNSNPGSPHVWIGSLYEGCDCAVGGVVRDAVVDLEEVEDDVGAPAEDEDEDDDKGHLDGLHFGLFGWERSSLWVYDQEMTFWLHLSHQKL